MNLKNKEYTLKLTIGSNKMQTSWRAAKPGHDRRTSAQSLVILNTLQCKFDSEEFRIHIMSL